MWGSKLGLKGAKKIMRTEVLHVFPALNTQPAPGQNITNFNAILDDVAKTVKEHLTEQGVETSVTDVPQVEAAAAADVADVTEAAVGHEELGQPAEQPTEQQAPPVEGSGLAGVGAAAVDPAAKEGMMVVSPTTKAPSSRDHHTRALGQRQADHAMILQEGTGSVSVGGLVLKSDTSDAIHLHAVQCFQLQQLEALITR